MSEVSSLVDDVVDICSSGPVVLGEWHIQQLTELFNPLSDSVKKELLVAVEIDMKTGCGWSFSDLKLISELLNVG